MNIAAIERRRQAIKRRMAELDCLSTSDARALDKAMTEMCALYAEYARGTVALVAFEAYRTLVERTPEDTGRARASWNLGAEPSDAVPSGGELRCEETTLQEPGTGQDGRYILSVTVDLHTFYTTQRSKA